MAADRLDARGDRVDRRLDRRGETIDRTLDRRGRQIDRRMDRRARLVAADRARSGLRRRRLREPAPSELYPPAKPAGREQRDALPTTTTPRRRRLLRRRVHVDRDRELIVGRRALGFARRRIDRQLLTACRDAGCRHRERDVGTAPPARAPGTRSLVR